MGIVIYGHGGSENHGNEAIVRGISNLFPKEELEIYSFSPDKDIEFGLGKVCKINSFVNTFGKYSVGRIVYYVLCRYFPKSSARFKMWFNPFIKSISRDNMYILEAGDQYCEDGLHRKFYAYLNSRIIAKGAKTVMLGCTIDEDVIKVKAVQEDLKRYTLIVARESVTYNNLIKNGINRNVKLAPDPAFAMKEEICELPEGFKRDTIGFNIGFLAQGNEVYYDVLVNNYIYAIQQLLDGTDYNVALIPHVNWNDELSDFNTLNYIAAYFNDKRVFVVKENSAPKQKYIISQCRFFVALRTHTAIPALESKVPTIIAGYKTKSMGICEDIFGVKEEFLADVQSLKGEDIIWTKLKLLIDNEVKVKEKVNRAVNEYLLKLRKNVEYIDAVRGD